MVACEGGYYGPDFKGVPGKDPGDPTVTNHIKCGGGHSGTPLGLAGGRGRGRNIDMGEGGAKQGRLFLFG